MAFLGHGRPRACASKAPAPLVSGRLAQRQEASPYSLTPSHGLSRAPAIPRAVVHAVGLCPIIRVGAACFPTRRYGWMDRPKAGVKIHGASGRGAAGQGRTQEPWIAWESP